MSSEKQRLVNVGHGWQVGAIVVGTAAICVGAWRIGQGPMAETIAGAIAFLLITFARLLARAGILTAPKGSGDADEFWITKGIRRAGEDIERVIARANMLGLFALAFAAMIGFIVLKQILFTCIKHFESPWVLGVVGGLMVAAIMAPWLGGDVVAWARGKGFVRETPAERPKPAPSRPAESITPASDPVVVQVVRRKKEQNDV